ncbi:exonuclease SbcCD subunit D [Paraferrimonas haliotis]|uniref:Nuclease SbcCD subunit D n=1 Tax=Paraferrimonas haliotis TaxID=2013866 RepID=A0AA37TTY4_9GAMM|nr:exonuclease SbcCD subunit D [Paraferrimonas haliotis]GLS82660.1 nuclease SbcCD subunit D [Paraferrimonas haliotis]
MITIVHSSDWHLGRSFHNVSLLDDQAIWLEQILQQVIEQQADALIIAGDLYDRSVPPAAAVALFDQFIERFRCQSQAKLIVISGNHDSATRLGFAANQLKHKGIHFITSFDDMLEPIIVSNASGEQAFVYGIPYCEPLQVRHHYQCHVSHHAQAHQFLVEQIKATLDESQSNVLVSHCFVDGASGCDSERPLSIGGSDAVAWEPMQNFTYVALGHLHGAQYRGAKHIRYSGSPMAYSFSEQHHKKGCCLVLIDNEGLANVEQLPLQPKRRMRVVEGRMAELIEQAKEDPNADDYLMVRLTDTHAIMDAMNKLRSVYPNILHLEKPGMLGQIPNRPQANDQIKQSELSMFADFYQQSLGRELTHEQRSLLTELLTDLHKQDV